MILHFSNFLIIIFKNKTLKMYRRSTVLSSIAPKVTVYHNSGTGLLNVKNN